MYIATIKTKYYLHTQTALVQPLNAPNGDLDLAYSVD